jgi:integrase
MASIQPHRGGYRVQVYVKGVRQSRVFPTRKEASQWALEREAELAGKRLPDRTLADACRRWEREETDKRGGGQWERLRLRRFREDFDIAERRLEALTAADFAAWRDARLASKKPATVAREMNLLRAVLEIARREWGWISANPLRDVRWPKSPKGRARRVSEEEVAALAKAFGVGESLKSETMVNRIGLAFLFALETGMRSGEICALHWRSVHLRDRYVTVEKSKNGDSRDVPLTMRAVEILSALPVEFGPVFGLDDKSRDVMFRRVRDKTPHTDVHFHDARSEAIWRLSRKLDVLELARAIGHRDVNSLMIYYRASASDLASRLD